MAGNTGNASPSPAKEEINPCLNGLMEEVEVVLVPELSKALVGPLMTKYPLLTGQKALNPTHWRPFEVVLEVDPEEVDWNFREGTKVAFSMAATEASEASIAKYQIGTPSANAVESFKTTVLFCGQMETTLSWNCLVVPVTPLQNWFN